MTDTKIHNAKDILSEALATIKATYWITGREFKMAHADSTWDEDNQDEIHNWDEWKEIEKAILVDLGESLEGEDEDGEEVLNPELGKAKVTGVCSIGALALASVTLYDEPLDRWTAIQDRDPQTRLAGAVLATEIAKHDAALPGEDDPDYDSENAPRFWLGGVTDVGNIIATWNDYEFRTREQVVAMFERAVANPALTSDQIYTLAWWRGFNGEGNYRRILGLVFASKEEAESFLAGDSPLAKQTKHHFEIESHPLIVEQATEYV